MHAAKLLRLAGYDFRHESSIALSVEVLTFKSVCRRKSRGCCLLSRNAVVSSPLLDPNSGFSCCTWSKA